MPALGWVSARPALCVLVIGGAAHLVHLRVTVDLGDCHVAARLTRSANDNALTIPWHGAGAKDQSGTGDSAGNPVPGSRRLRRGATGARSRSWSNIQHPG